MKDPWFLKIEIYDFLKIEIHESILIIDDLNQTSMIAAGFSVRFLLSDRGSVVRTRETRWGQEKLWSSSE